MKPASFFAVQCQKKKFNLIFKRNLPEAHIRTKLLFALIKKLFKFGKLDDGDTLNLGERRKEKF